VDENDLDHVEAEPLDRDGELPPYVQIADRIAARIKSGELQPRRPIPSETTMMQMYESQRVARTTIRRAINRLREQGLIYTVPGRGSFVAPPEDRPAD
jgi:DNA-binding GntR family transcriptional regulator